MLRSAKKARLSAFTGLLLIGAGSLSCNMARTSGVDIPKKQGAAAGAGEGALAPAQ